MRAIPTPSARYAAKRPGPPGYGTRVDSNAIPVPAYAAAVDGSFYRGLFFAVLFVMPLWALSGVAFWWLVD